MFRDIQGRFESNVDRVRSILAVYDELTPEGSGRRNVQLTDLLRTAVVLTHASLEDLLRSLAEWKLPTAPPESLRSIPLAGTSSDPRRPRFSMSELAAHRGRTVDEVIQESIGVYLERSNFNHPGEVKGVVEGCGGDPAVVDAHKRWVGPMMERRHWIVHRADRNYTQGRGQHGVRSLGRGTVERWIAEVEKLGRTILEQFR